jgi:hypothetical protein
MSSLSAISDAAMEFDRLFVNDEGRICEDFELTGRH